MSFELFRRIAHDAISTPDLVPDDESIPVDRDGQPVTAAYATLARRDDSGRVPAAGADGRGARRRHGRRPSCDAAIRAPSAAAPSTPGWSSPATCSSPCRASGPTATGSSPRPPSAGCRRDPGPRGARRGRRRGAARRPRRRHRRPSSPDTLRALPRGRRGLARAGSRRSSSGSPAASPRPPPRRPSRACWAPVRHAPHGGQPEQRGRPAADRPAARARSTRPPCSRWGCTSAARSASSPRSAGRRSAS